MVKAARRFKKKHPNWHITFVALSILMIWRGGWYLLDHYVIPDNELLSHVIPLVVAFVFLYMDDFHLKELH